MDMEVDSCGWSNHLRIQDGKNILKMEEQKKSESLITGK